MLADRLQIAVDELITAVGLGAEIAVGTAAAAERHMNIDA